MSSVYVIWNPTAGSGNGNKTYQKISDYLGKKDIPFSSGMTEYPGHATKLAAEAIENGFRRILVLGGDGTIREAASSVFGTEAVLGIIPCGSGNDLIKSLKIPLDPVQALEIALSDNVRKMDVGSANGKLFFNVAGLGFDVDVLVATASFRQKGFKGSFAYLLGLFKCLANISLRKCTIRTPERTLEKNALIIAAGNGTHIGGGMNVTPGADPYDGKFNVCILHDVTKASVPVVLPKFLSGTHTTTKYCTYFQTTELEITCEPDSLLELDGEIMPGTPVTFKILPGMINLAAPVSE